MRKDKEIVEILKQLRERRWSDAAIGKELGVSAVTIWRWRNEKQGIDMPTLVKRALQELLERP
jgi:transcriptional regulator with XRE-family HTH domain